MNPDKDKTPVPDDYAPLSVRDFRQMRKSIGHLWISFATIVILAAAQAIVCYRVGAQSCH
jgi:hypothetical protein